MSKRQSLWGAVICLYFFPLALAILYRLPLFSSERNWSALAVGLVLISFGSILLFFYIKRLVTELTPKEVAPKAHPQMEDLIKLEASLNESKKTIEEYETKLAEKTSEMKRIQEAKEHSEEKIKALQHQLEESKEQLNGEINHQKIMLDEYAQSIKEQREIIQKKQQQITDFENRVHDLSYEVKTLLHIADVGTPSHSGPKEAMMVSETAQEYHIPPETIEDDPITPVRRVRSLPEARSLLRRCIETAQKTTHTHPFTGSSPRMRHLPIDNYALDFRRLFDNLRSENSGIILLYSQKEKRLLFANHQAQALLGWSTEQIIQHFPDFINEGLETWNEELTRLKPGTENAFALSLRDRSGETSPFQALMTAIPTGIFKHHAIAILYQES